MVVGQVCLVGSSQNLSFIHLQRGKSDFPDWKYGAGRFPALCSEFVPAAVFFVALLMKERLVLRAVMTTWLVCGVGESCCGHWSAGGWQTGEVWSPAHLPASCLPLTPVLAPPGPYHSV